MRSQLISGSGTDEDGVLWQTIKGTVPQDFLRPGEVRALSIGLHTVYPLMPESDELSIVLRGCASRRSFGQSSHALKLRS